MATVSNLHQGSSRQSSSDIKDIFWKDGTIHRIQDNLASAKEVSIYAVVGIVALPIIAAVGTVVCLANSLFSAAQAIKHHVTKNTEGKNQALANLKEHTFWLKCSIVSLIPGASLVWAARYLLTTMPHPINPDVRIRDFGVVR